MVKLNTSYSFSRVPYIGYDALDSYAEEVVADFAPELLNNPSVLNAEAFLEFYLGLSTRYCNISHSKQVLGVIAFNDGLLEVANEETGGNEAIIVEAGTVVLDSSLTTKRNKPRLRFTSMHEGSHWLIHKEAFAKDNPLGIAGAYGTSFVAAKEGRVDYSRSTKERTDIERIERQADFLASAILMPRPALREAYREFFHSHGEKARRIIKGCGNPLDDVFAAKLPQYIADLFGVSKRAALIRLEKLSAIVDNKTWRGARH